MNSFYGGKQGSSFIISQTYATIKEMLDDFGKNNVNCAVNFDEYVLINTVNKNNPENGQVFRRGYDYNSSRKIKTYQPTYGQANPYETIEVPANGAVYIGTIVGPAGRAPIFNFGNYEEVQDSCALLTRTFTDIELNKNDSQQTIVTTLNKNYPNGKEILKEGEKEKSFYSLKIVDNLEAPSIYYYFCYDNKYKLSNQEYGGWYAVDSRPATGEDEYRIETNSLVPGVTYSYDETDNSLIYEYDKDKNRHIKLGINKINEDKIDKGKEIKAEDMPYQDSIDWTYCTIRNENLEDSTAYVGFRFAYPVVELETKQVSAYYNRNDKTDEEEDDKATRNFDNVNLITRMVRDYAVDKEGNPTDVVENRPATQDDIEKHPFYSLWEIAIPKGIKGDCIRNFRVVTANEDVQAFDLKDGELQYNEKNLVKVKDYPGQQDDIKNERKIFVFDFVSYDRIPTGDMQTIYVGDYNVFKEKEAVKLKHNGELTFTYTHDDPYKTPQDDWIHWIDTMHFKEDGTITITFNDKDWEVQQADNQDEIKNGVLTKPNLIKWIKEIKLDEETGHYFIKFNYDKEPKKDENGNILYDDNGIIYGDDTLIKGDLTWLKYFNVDDEGNVTYTYTHDTETSISRTDNNVIKWINNISLNTGNGEIYIEFNNNAITGEKIKTKTIETEKGSKEVSYYQDYLQWIKDIEVQNDGTIKYDGTQQDRSQNKLIKWINEFSLDEKNGHLLIKFNNDQLNTGQVETLDDESQISIIDKNLTWVKDITIDKEGTVTTDYTTEYTGEGKDDEGNRVQSHLLHWINQMNFADDGTVTVNFNNKDLNDGQIESGNITLPQLIKWITEVKLNNENGKFEIDFNYPEKTNKDGSIIPNTKTHYETDLTWVKDIQINSDNGQVTIDYTNLDNNTDTKLQWIKNITIDDDGTVKYDGTQQNSTQEKLITWIKSCSFDESTGNLKIDFNNNNKVSNIDTTINFIKQVAVTPTGQVLVLYSDPKQQGKISYDGIDTWTEVSQLPHSKCSSANLTDADKNEVINNLLPYTSCYWIEEIE